MISRSPRSRTSIWSTFGRWMRKIWMWSANFLVMAATLLDIKGADAAAERSE